MTLPTSIIATPKVDLPHHRIHESIFAMVNVVNTGLIVANPKRFLLKTPGILPDGTALFGHVIFSVSTNPGATVQLFENTIVSFNGTDISAILNNRNPPPGIPLVVTGFVFEDPVVVSEGTQIFIERIGSTTKGGIGGPKDRDEDELIFKIGTNYLIKITPLVDGIDITTKIRNYSNRSGITPPVPPP